MKKTLFILSLIVGFAFVAWKHSLFTGNLTYGTAELLGGVVRTDDPAGGRLYYLTGQWEKRLTRIGNSRNSTLKTTSWHNIDLWEIDAATAQPLHRRRIKREKVNADCKAMGMEQGILWARIPELVGIRLSDGRLVADKAKIEAKNPTLAGLIPKPPGSAFFLTESMQPLKFDPDIGMIVRLDDARLVRIDPLTLEATPHTARPSDSKAPVPADPSALPVRSKVVSPSNGMDWYAMVRGLTIEKPGSLGDWLGLLAEDELARVKEQKTYMTHQMDFTTPRRHRLYRGELRHIDSFMGRSVEYHNLQPLPDAPEFLMAGLLTQGPGGFGRQSALWHRDPDSVFVISRDRLGDEGHMQLARISGPKGVPVWNISLPVTALSAWLPGERHAIILGPDPTAKRSPMAEENDNPVLQILSIDLTTGKLSTFNPDLHRDWPVDGTSPKTPKTP